MRKVNSRTVKHRRTFFWGGGGGIVQFCIYLLLDKKRPFLVNNKLNILHILALYTHVLKD